MRETRARLRAAGATWREMPARWDVDRPEDYRRLLASGLLAEAGRMKAARGPRRVPRRVRDRAGRGRRHRAVLAARPGRGAARRVAPAHAAAGRPAGGGARGGRGRDRAAVAGRRGRRDRDPRAGCRARAAPRALVAMEGGPRGRARRPRREGRRRLRGARVRLLRRAGRGASARRAREGAPRPRGVGRAPAHGRPLLRVGQPPRRRDERVEPLHRPRAHRGAAQRPRRAPGRRSRATSRPTSARRSGRSGRGRCRASPASPSATTPTRRARRVTAWFGDFRLEARR